MNVVGKVGSLITQGVYSVATPFHPFGGAVDIIVVQQQDGSFRSTPWYVQFGKFQGVLKGAEKVVRINVNGVEANFHMYLDNSGEAYFIREVDSGLDGDKNGGSKDESEGTLEHSLSVDNDQCNNNMDDVENFRLQSSLSDPGLLRDDFSSFRTSRLERNESDACRFYDFQDDQSIESPVELSSEYGSGRYDNIDVENFTEAQGSDSEMVLVSVDGHILTAPISASEQNNEVVQLDTPQFHLGPGEGDSSFTVSENAWDSEYLNDLDAPSSQSRTVEVKNIHLHLNVPETCNVEDTVVPDQLMGLINQSKMSQNKGTNALHDSEASNEGEENAHQENNALTSEGLGNSVDGSKETLDLKELKCEVHGVHGDQGVENLCGSESCEEEKRTAHRDPEDFSLPSDAEDTSPVLKNEDRFRSCLDLTKEEVDETSESEDSPSKATEVKDLDEKPSLNVRESHINEIEYASEKSYQDVVATNDNSVGDDAGVKVDDDSCSSAPDLQTSSSLSTSVVGQAGERVHTGMEAVEIASGNKDEDVNQNPSLSAAESNSEAHICATESYGSEVIEGQTKNSSEQRKTNLSSTIEISLCRHLLRPGMGSSSAGETFDAHRILEEEFRSIAVSVIKNENLVIRYKEKYLPWDKAAPIVLGIAAFGADIPVESKDAIAVEQEVTQNLGESDSGSASARRWRLWSIPFRRVKTLQHTNSNSSEDVFVDSESIAQSPSFPQTPTSQGGTTKSESCKSPHKKLIRTNIPTNEQIASLNLKEGQNDVTFSFSTRVLGVQQVEAHIYLWKWNARIVISDVDGTITKSDVLGQFMPLVGKDWSQSGVARLFSAIKENGYQLLFLSARAIVQAYLTKSFLFNLKQDGKTLPTGPVVISPNGLFPSLFREVIRRAPHEFKIACLEDIRALFPPDCNPFYAGFGNRDTDELTYKKIGIPKGKIFIINPKGEVAINHRIDAKSYTSLHTLVNDMFPPTSMLEQEDYNAWNYWRMPLPDIDG
uniref:phosphatidate phosphatase n=1 Tax=Opuntia streptacantha TaxID=393608 RepID=A0A7C9AMV7_OPUST